MGAVLVVVTYYNHVMIANNNIALCSLFIAHCSLFTAPHSPLPIP